MNKSVDEKGHSAHTVRRPSVPAYKKSLYGMPFKSLTSVPVEEQSIMTERGHQTKTGQHG